MVEYVLDGTVLDKQFGRRLGPHAGDTRDIVRTVPHQALHVDEADRCESVLLLECCRIIGTRLTDPLFRQQDSEPRADQLQCVPIPRDDDRLRTSPCRLRCKRTDDIVGFVAIHLEKGNPEGLGQLLQQRNLRDQFLGGLVPRALIRRIQLRAECRAALVERDDDLRRREFLHQLHEHHRKTMHRIRMDAACIRRELQRIERAEEKAAPIQDCKLCLHRRGISSFSRRIRIKR